MKPTKRQKEILDFISGFMDREGYAPSMEEIADHFGLASLNSVFKHLTALEARGHLRRHPNRARSIEIAASLQTGVQAIPFYGYVAAGKPIEAVSVAETMMIPDDLLPGSGSHYVLRVQGESMIDEHIQNGDYVIVESRAEAKIGEMVVALVDGENVTFKKFYREENRIRLQPSNPDLAPLVLDEDRVKIQGVIVGIMRKYR